MFQSMPTKFGNNHGMQHLSMMQEGKSADMIDPNKSVFQARLSPKLWRCKNVDHAACCKTAGSIAGT
jgi:hypothetical protein